MEIFKKNWEGQILDIRTNNESKPIDSIRIKSIDPDLDKDTLTVCVVGKRKEKPNGNAFPVQNFTIHFFIEIGNDVSKIPVRQNEGNGEIAGYLNPNDASAFYAIKKQLMDN